MDLPDGQEWKGTMDGSMKVCKVKHARDLAGWSQADKPGVHGKGQNVK